MKNWKKRGAVVAAGLAAVGVAAALVLNALNSNIALYVTPSDVATDARHQSASPSSATRSSRSNGRPWKRCFRTSARTSPASSARPAAASRSASSGVSALFAVRVAAR